MTVQNLSWALQNYEFQEKRFFHVLIQKKLEMFLATHFGAAELWNWWVKTHLQLKFARPSLLMDEHNEEMALAPQHSPNPFNKL